MPVDLLDLKDPFTSNYSLFMERFPALALEMPRVGPKIAEKEDLCPIASDPFDLIYFYGIGCAEGYFQLHDWLEKKSSRRLIFLEDDFCSISSFLHTNQAEQVLQEPQVFFAHPRDAASLAEQFPVEKIEAYCLPSRKGRKFHALRLQLLRKTALTYALHLDRLEGSHPFENFALNLRHLSNSFYANQLQGKFQGVPAIVCGAGPSLSQAIPFLKTLENRALIIAGGSTLAALSSQGLNPHFGMVVDPNGEEYLRLRNSFAFETPLLYSTRVMPDVFHTCNGPFGYMRSGIGGISELWMEEALGLTGPLLSHGMHDEAMSVTSTCLAWAHWLGCNPILFSGMDLAYTNRLRYAPGIDCKNTPDAEASVNRMIKTKDQQGRSVFTAVRWLMESETFSHFAASHPETVFLNTTEGGIGFRGIPYGSLKEAAERFLDKEWDLRERVHREIIAAPMPAVSKQIIDQKMQELGTSLSRVIERLEILSKEKPGSSVLAEMELSEEMAYSCLFYDMQRVLDRVCFLDPKKEKWKAFLEIARSYQRALQFF